MGDANVMPNSVRDHLFGWCVVFGSICGVIGLGLLKGAVSLDLLLAGGVLCAIAVGFFFFAHKLNPQDAARLFQGSASSRKNDVDA